MSQRITRVSELMKRELGQCLERDFHFPDVLVTVHHVQVSPDLRNAQVFIGVIGSPVRGEEVVAMLNRKKGQIQAQLMKRVVLKYTPQLRFECDDSVERGVRVVNLLDEIAESLTKEGEDANGKENRQDDRR